VTTAPSTIDSTRQRLRAVFGGSVGNLIEWYDWYTYSACSIYFAPLFFPNDDPTTQLLNSAAIYAGGFLIRPLGGWVLGRYADRSGRKAALTLSVMLMCLGSLLIAFAPAYAHVGLAAPVTLIFARLLQGFSVGGEYGTSATYMSEVTPAHQRGFIRGFCTSRWSWVSCSRWRCCWSCSGCFSPTTSSKPGAGAFRSRSARWRRSAACICGAICRSRRRSRSIARVAARSGEVRLLLQHPREVAIVIGLTAGGTLYFYIFTTYIQQFLANTVGLSKTDATTVSSASLFLFMLMQPLMGALSDRIGRRPMLITFGVLALLTTVPLLSTLAQAHSAWMAFVLVTLALAISSFYSSISAVVKAELFPVEIRALGVGLPYAVAVSLFGGTAPFIGLWFKSIGHESWFYWYVTVCVLGSLLVYIFMREPQRTSRI
jgi:MHS family alpha-ketoglutarate permease-like MFS transporter